MRRKIDQYLDKATDSIKNKKQRLQVRYELLDHIEESIESYQTSMSENQAITKTLEDMGNPLETAKEFKTVYTATHFYLYRALCITLILTLSSISLNIYNFYFTSRHDFPTSSNAKDDQLYNDLKAESFFREKQSFVLDGIKYTSNGVYKLPDRKFVMEIRKQKTNIFKTGVTAYVFDKCDINCFITTEIKIDETTSTAINNNRALIVFYDIDSLPDTIELFYRSKAPNKDDRSFTIDFRGDV